MTTNAAPALERTPIGRGAARQFAAGAYLFVILFGVASVPYFYAAFSTPPDRVYTGLMFDVPDHAQYWSWVTASRAGLFISNTMTPEVNPPIFMNPMMWLLAKVQGLFGLSFAALFQVWRAAATLLLVAALLAVVRAVMPDRERRRTALWVALAGSGFGWLLVVLKTGLRLPDVPFPMDVYVVEPNTFFGLLAYPHLVLAQALLLSTLLGVWQAHRGRGWPAHLLAGASALGLALSHPYDLLTVYAILAVFGAVVLAQTRRFPWPLVVSGVVVVAFSAPTAFYYQNLTAHDPLWRSILAQYANAGVWTPAHLHLVVLMGLPLLLAIVGLFPATARDDRFWFVAVWAAVGLVLIYIPVVYQIKFLGGWQFPLAILATHAWHDRVVPSLGRWIDRIPHPAVSREAMCRAVIVLLVVPTNLYLFSWRFVELRRHAAPYYMHRDEAAAFDWLAGHASERDVVIAPEITGQFVPNYGRTRAYLAHWAMTNRYHERSANVRKFFDPATSDPWRERLIADEGVTLVLRAGSVPGLEETWDPGGSGFVEPLLKLPQAQLYRIRRPERQPPIPEGGR
jgi:hypothetical protein